MIYIIAILLLIFMIGLFLGIASKVLLVIIYPFNLIVVLIKFVKKYRFRKTYNDYNFQDALETDIFLHRNYRALWNLTSSKGGTLFGRRNMTLSAMMGLKFKEKTITGLLYFFYYFLYVVDYKNWWWFYKKQGHCLEAYDNYLHSKKHQL